MSAATKITRTDRTAAGLRGGEERRCRQDPAAMALAMILDGRSRPDAAKAGIDRQILRDRVHRYNEAGIDGLVSRKPPGRSPKLTKVQVAELRELVVASPELKTHKVVRWRSEPRRVCRRLRTLRGWSHDEEDVEPAFA